MAIDNGIVNKWKGQKLSDINIEGECWVSFDES